MFGKLDAYLNRSFLRIFIRTVAISVFILMMQMVWKYIEDLSGRGIDPWYLLQLLFFWSASVLPMAVPIAVLFAGIMVFGELAENNEFAALRSGGVGFFRMTRPLWYFLAVLGIGMFYVTNNLIPVANFKGENLLINIAQKKPTFNLQPGYFYHGLEGYTVKIGQKSDNEVWDVMIYDHTLRGQGNYRLITSPYGRLIPLAGGRWLEIELQEGSIYEEVFNTTRQERTRRPYVRARFDTARFRFNMSTFETGNLYEVQRANQFNMLNLTQLKVSLDSLNSAYSDRTKEFQHQLIVRFSVLEPDSIRSLETPLATYPHATGRAFFESKSALDQNRILQNAIFTAENQLERLEQMKMEMAYRRELAARHSLEWHRKFSISVACVLLFFIGAPLGAMIRKGGFGLPFVLSVLLFLIYYVLTIVFEKMGRSDLLTPGQAIWLPNIILLPLSVFLTFAAARDLTWNPLRKNAHSTSVQ